MSWLGLDIGGANLKAATTAGWACSVPFALWRDPQGLSGALAALIAAAPRRERVAVTMTGELCDCFRSKAEGVQHILAAVREASHSKDVRVYLADGRFVSADEACQVPQLAAASNWRALAQLACGFVDAQVGLLIDIGSTTTDIIPLVKKHVAARGRNDIERLESRELLYSGVGRTPVCAVTRTLPRGGRPCPVAAEVFSTTADAYVLLGQIDEDPQANWTADGRPLTDDHARQRLARQLCADANDFDAEEVRHMAQAVRDAQLNQLGESLAVVTASLSEPPRVVVLSGAGEFLGRAAAETAFGGCAQVSLANKLRPEISRCGPAYAVAVLALEASEPAAQK